MVTNSSFRVFANKSLLRFSKKRSVLVGLLAYAFLYDNSTSLPSVRGYVWTRLFDLPRQVRFIEIGVVGIIVLFLLARPISRLTRNLLLAILVFCCLSTSSYLATMLGPVVDVFRLLYAYLLPALLFIIGREMRLDARARHVLFCFLLIWVAISAMISWYQFIALGYPIGDDITGLNKDAHANGNLLVIASLILIARGLWLRRRSEIGLALFFMLTMVLSSVLKTMFFSVLAFGYVAYSYMLPPKSSLRWRQVGRFIGVGVLLVSLAGVVFIAFTSFDLLSSNRLGDAINRITSDPFKFGPIVAHAKVVKLLASSPESLLIGYGPYSYANPISFGQTLEQGSLARYARKDLLALVTDHGEDAKVTLTSSWLAELGPLATAMLVLIYGTILIRVWRCVRSDDQENRAYAVALVGCLIVLYLTASTSLFGSLEVISVSWPVMLLAGILVRLEMQGRKIQQVLPQIINDTANFADIEDGI